MTDEEFREMVGKLQEQLNAEIEPAQKVVKELDRWFVKGQELQQEVLEFCRRNNRISSEINRIMQEYFESRDVDPADRWKPDGWSLNAE